MGQKKQRRPKHIPQRTCIVCRRKLDKRLLTRVVRTPDNGVVVDPTGKRNGRGAYLCEQAACWDKITENTRLLNQALKAEMSAEELAVIATYKDKVAHQKMGRAANT